MLCKEEQKIFQRNQFLVPEDFLAEAYTVIGILIRAQVEPDQWTPGSPVAVETVGNWYWVVDEVEAGGGKPQLVNARLAKLMIGNIFRSIYESFVKVAVKFLLSNGFPLQARGNDGFEGKRVWITTSTNLSF